MRDELAGPPSAGRDAGGDTTDGAGGTAGPSRRRASNASGALGGATWLSESLRAAVRWRSWRLPVKLAAVTLVPVVFAIVLSAIQISDNVDHARQYAALDSRVAVGTTVRAAVSAAQHERNLAAVARGERPSRTDTKKAEEPLDRAVAATRKAVASAGRLDPVSAARWADTEFQLGRLSAIRSQWRSNPDAAITGYSDVIGSLLALDRALAGSGGDRSVIEPAIALYDLDGVTEQLFQQQSLVLAGITRGHMLPSEVAALRDAQARKAGKLADFQAISSPEEQRRFAAVVNGQQANKRDSYLQQAIENAPVQRPQRNANDSEDATALAAAESSSVEPLSLRAADWNASSDAVTGGAHKVTDGLANTVLTNAARLRDGANTAALIAALVLVCALLLAAAVVWIVATQLVRSMRTLHASARDIATNRLPAVVADLERGEQVTKAVEPVPLDTSDEVGQLARAFDAVHGQARKLAVEQASLRNSYGNVFVNLSRRSQSLVQRQLRLIEQLERDEEDPAQLSTLFALDHLATRMRRNNENLMVLSGSGQGRSERGRAGDRQSAKQVGELLRAAASEIEHYQRVTLHVPPAALVVGYAAGDLVRLLAELLDNATAFSSPETSVTVSTHLSPEGALVIDIVDQGIGMRDDDLAAANEKLSGTGSTDLPVSRRMGLFVVARLADQHGLVVRLHGGGGIVGLRASVTVPAPLILGEPLAPTPRPELPVARGAMTNGVPRQVPGAGSRDDLAGVSAAETATEGPSTGESLSAAALFAAPNSEPEDTPEAAGEPLRPPYRPSRVEKTPIFDEMVSAWFDATAPGEPERDGGDGEGDDRWNFSSDRDWRMAVAAANVEPECKTPAGLPKRVPRARLVPGSASTERADSGMAARDPQHIRRRLSRFQQGVASGRGLAGWTDRPPAAVPETQESVEPEPTSADAGTTAAEQAATSQAERDAAAPADRARPETPTHRSGLPQRRPARTRQASAEGGADRGAGSEPTGTPQDAAGSEVPETRQREGRWQFAADESWRAVAEVMETTSERREALTAAGLPRREPRARLLPGSIDAANAQLARVSQRDPHAVRDRLASFQRGIQDGRESVATPSTSDYRQERSERQGH